MNRKILIFQFDRKIATPVKLAQKVAPRKFPPELGLGFGLGPGRILSGTIFLAPFSRKGQKKVLKKFKTQKYKKK